MNDSNLLGGWIFLAACYLLAAPLFILLSFCNTIIHELGHFCVAKLCGLKVTLLKIGGGKPIFKRKIGKTMFILAKRSGSKRSNGGMVAYEAPSDNLKGLCISFAGPGSSLLLVTLYLVFLRIYAPIPEFLAHDPWLMIFLVLFTIVAIPSIFIESFAANLTIKEDSSRSLDGFLVAFFLVKLWRDRFKKDPPRSAVGFMIYLIPLLPLTIWGAAIITFFWKA